MAKSTPTDRWRKRTLEHIQALKLSGEIMPLRKKGLVVCNRDKLFTSEEWRQSFSERARLPEYLKWHEECKAVADKYDLAPWVVSMMCLVKGYKPEKDVGFITMEGDWPSVRIVTKSNNPEFVRILSTEAQRLRLVVVQRLHGVESTLLNLDHSGSDDDSSTGPKGKKSGPDDKFILRVETPVGFPPEEAVKLQRKASKLSRELGRRMGFHIPERLRTSKLVEMSKALKVAKGPLKNGDIYNVIDKIDKSDDLSKDQKLRKQIASQRHRGRERLIKPYQNDKKSLD